MTSTAATASPSALPDAIESIAGVGPTRGKVFRALGVRSLGDLLEYFPRDYRLESEEKPISELRPDEIHMARGEVLAVNYSPGRPRPRFEATLSDSTGKLALTWFNAAYLQRRIHPGLQIRVQGKVTLFRYMPQMVNPKWTVVDESTAVITESKFKSIYPASLRLPSESIASVVRDNLEAMLAEVHEWFDESLLNKRGLISRREAYRWIHRPADLPQAMRARRRLVYDELMLMQLGLGLGKRLRAGRISAPIMRIDKLLDERIRRRFSFEMTGGQQQAVWQIARDVRSGQPMNRLLQGDVGSGKTAVALYGMLVAVANKLQAALLAPTEVLAEQHFLTLSRTLKDSSVTIDLITNRTKRQEKSRRLKALAGGTLHIAVGTQALIQEDVEFANLGLVVVDEQHKLGVRQRGVLKSKGLSPHYLVMTATPIPRTLALSYFADFDITTIDELPPGRQPIQTRWVRSDQSKTAYDFIRQQVSQGRQAYLVVPQVEDNGLDDSKSVAQEFKRLSQGPLAGLRLAMLHGQMATEEKQQAMSRFRDREVDVLIATTVIEVGIDVPNATVIVIDNADHFGLSQLHQLRGRVGRGTEQSHCILIADPRSETASTRMRVMCETGDGFEIAEMDLGLRGPGQFFGTRQHGLPEFKLADITNELSLLQEAKEDAAGLLETDPRLTSPDHRHLRMALMKQLGDSLSLAQIG